MKKKLTCMDLILLEKYNYEKLDPIMHNIAHGMIASYYRQPYTRPILGSEDHKILCKDITELNDKENFESIIIQLAGTAAEEIYHRDDPKYIPQERSRNMLIYDLKQVESNILRDINLIYPKNSLINKKKSIIKHGTIDAPTEIYRSYIDYAKDTLEDIARQKNMEPKKLLLSRFMALVQYKTGEGN